MGEGKRSERQFQGFCSECLEEWNCHQLALEIEGGNHKIELGQVFKIWVSVGFPSREESAIEYMTGILRRDLNWKYHYVKTI